jgi:hypothetical protein
MDEFQSEGFEPEECSSTSGFDVAPSADEGFSQAAVATDADPFGAPPESDTTPLGETTLTPQTLPEYQPEALAPTTDSFSMPEYEPETSAPTNEAFSLPEPTAGTGSILDKEAEFNEAWETRLTEAAAEEAAAKQALKEEAEKYLDLYHDQRTDSKQAKMETNRKQEVELSAEKDRALEEARKDDISQWRRAYDLIDVDAATGSDAERMRKLLVSLKVKGLN